MKGFIKRIAIYVITGTIITTIPLYYLNNVLLAETRVDEIKVVDVKKVVADVKKEGATIPEYAEGISITNKEDVIGYLQNGQVILKNVKTDEEVKRIVDEHDIVYFKPLYDRNIILYFMHYDNKLEIKTYNMDLDEKMEHKTFKVGDLNRIKDVKYSHLTNVIYILVETKTSKGTLDKIYRVDIMKNVELYLADSNEIMDIEQLNKEDKLIYQDSYGNVYDNGKKIYLKVNKSKISKFDILGIDEMDNLYLIGREDRNLYIYRDKELVSGKNINIEYDRIFNKNNKIYAVGKNDIYDVINNKPIHKKAEDEIVDILNDRILYKHNGLYKINKINELY